MTLETNYKDRVTEFLEFEATVAIIDTIKAQYARTFLASLLPTKDIVHTTSNPVTFYERQECSFADASSLFTKLAYA